MWVKCELASESPKLLQQLPKVSVLKLEVQTIDAKGELSVVYAL
jgi:hypothetical protein